MRDMQKFFPVNWVDGMKINKTHFVEQDNAWLDQLHRVATLPLSAVCYGVLPPALGTRQSFDVKISYDNQNALKVAVHALQAITIGGIFINIPADSLSVASGTQDLLTKSFTLTLNAEEKLWWIFLVVHPFEKHATGSPDVNENPPRFPHVVPTYNIEMVNESNYAEYAQNPYALVIGKVQASANGVASDEEYIPPCMSLSAHPDLLSLYGEMEKYLTSVEVHCSDIIQKIYRKSQQNDISELVLFLCDRVMFYIGDAITKMRWQIKYEPPASMFQLISALSRVMKNSIDMRIGSGKDELMNYLSEWCELKQGELETMLGDLSNTDFNQNDLNQNIKKVVRFVKVTLRLFNSLSKLEFIGKKKESGIFVKEEAIAQEAPVAKPRRRFLG